MLTQKNKHFIKLADEIIYMLSELPRRGYLFPYPIVNLVTKIGLIKKIRFRYATPAQHYFVMPEIMVKKKIISLVHKITVSDENKTKKEITSINKQIKSCNDSLEELQKFGHNIEISILQKIEALEKEKERIDAKFIGDKFCIQKMLMDDFIAYFEWRIKDFIRIKEFGNLENIFDNLVDSLKDNNENNLSIGIQLLTRTLNLPEGIFIPSIKGHRIGYNEISLCNKFILSLLNEPKFKEAVRTLENFRFYKRAHHLIEQFKRGKNEIIPRSFLKDKVGVSYELIFTIFRFLIASLITIIPILINFSLIEITKLPFITLLWVSLTFSVTYYIANLPANKLALAIMAIFVKIPGHNILRNLFGYVDSNYTNDNPLKIAYFIMKKSESLIDVDTTFFYLKKTIDALEPTLEKFGRKIEFNFILASDSKNEEIDYELKSMQSLSKNFKCQNNIFFTYMNRSKSEWFNNVENAQLRTGGFAGKVGGIATLMNFLCTGQTKHQLFIDEGFEHSQSPTKPFICKIWSNNLSYICGFDNQNDQELSDRIISGEELGIRKDRIPDFTILMDDKNELFAGEIEKALAILLHPRNKHIVIGQPYISITPSHNTMFVPLESAYWRMAKENREIENTTTVRLISEIYGHQRAFFGKGIVRTKEYFDKVFKAEVLSPSKVLSHDWQESVFSMDCEGLYGYDKFKIKIISQKNNQSLIRIDFYDYAKFIKIKIDQDGIVEVFDLNSKTGEYKLERKFSSLKEEKSMDKVIRYVVNFYNNYVVFGEREALSFITYLTRDMRWLIGDLQAIRTMISYKKILTPYHQWHLRWILARVLNDSALLTFLFLINILGIFKVFIKIPSFVFGYILSLVVIIIAVVIIPKIIDPIMYSLRKRHAQGKIINPLVLLATIAQNIVYGMTNTIISILTSLQLTISKPRLIFFLYGLEKLNKIPPWKTSTSLTLAEQENRITRKGFKDLKLTYNPAIAIIIMIIFSCYIYLGIIPFVAIGIFGILPWVLSLFFGNYVIKFYDRSKLYKDFPEDKMESRRNITAVFSIILFLSLFCAALSIKQIPTKGKPDFIKLILPESKNKFSYSKKEERLLKAIDKKMRKSEFCLSPVLIIQSPREAFDELINSYTESRKELKKQLIYINYNNKIFSEGTNLDLSIFRIRLLANKYPLLSLNKKGKAEWFSIFVIMNNLSLEELEDRYFKPMQAIFKDCSLAYTDTEAKIMARFEGKEFDLGQSIADIAMYNLQRIYDLNLSFDDLKEVLKILEIVKYSNLDYIKKAQSIEHLQSMQIKMDSIAYRLFYIKKLVFSSNNKSLFVNSLKKSSSFNIFLTKFLNRMSSLHNDRKINEMVSYHNLEFSWAFWMTVKDIDINVIKDIVSRIDSVNLSYEKIMNFVPSVESGIAFHDALDEYIRGKYMRFFAALNREYQKIQTAWWSNYIIKNAYREIFNINLNEENPEDKKILREIYLWTEREKIKYPNQHVFEKVVKLIIKNGTVNQIKYGKIIFDQQNDYKERIFKTQQYILKLEPLVYALKSSNFYTADIEGVLDQLKSDLIRLNILSDIVLQQTSSVEGVIMTNEAAYKARLLILSSIIFGMMILSYFGYVLWKKTKKRHDD